MSVKCGNCKDYHETAADVRACYGPKAARDDESLDRRPLPASKAATDKQKAFLNSLREQLGLPALPDYNGTKKDASQAISDHLIDVELAKKEGRWIAPRKAEAPAATEIKFSEIQPGYYAVKSLSGNNDLDFFWVTVPENGKWKSYRFVKRIVGGHSPIWMPKSAQMAALKAIAGTDAAKAQKLFAQELGRCYRCGKTLTDDISRELGIGPVCRDK